MMHYRKGPNVEHELKKEELPFEDCIPKGQDFLWMRVKGGTRVNSVISYAKNALDKGEYRTMVWTGIGGGVVKAVSCAEIMKRTHQLYQVTRMSHSLTEEHWEPQMDGLDPLVAKRQTPCLHVLMTLDEIDVDGVQKPNVATDLVRRANGRFAGAASSSGRGQRGYHRGGQQRRYPNQGQRGNGERGPNTEQRQQQQQQKQQQTQQQQQQQQQQNIQQQRHNTSRTGTQSQSEQQIAGSGEIGIAKRKRNHRKPKPKPKEPDNVDSNAPQTSQGQQKPNKNTRKETTERKPMEY